MCCRVYTKWQHLNVKGKKLVSHVDSLTFKFEQLVSIFVLSAKLHKTVDACLRRRPTSA